MRPTSVLIAFLFSTLLADLSHAVTIQGFVRIETKIGVPPDGVTHIQVFYKKANGEVDSVEEKADKTGAYSISIKDNLPIVAVVYTNSRRPVRMVKELSNQPGDNQKINMVLPDPDGPDSFDEIVEQIHQYEDLYWLEWEIAGKGANPEAVRKKARDKFQKRIIAMPDPRRAQQGEAQTKVIRSIKNEQKERLLARKMEELFVLYGIEMRSNLAQSKWETRYLDANGSPVKVIVAISGATGSYEAENGTKGQLSEVSIEKAGKGLSIQGKWRLTSNGKIGSFRWFISAASPTSFEGMWESQKGQQHGWWNGELILIKQLSLPN